MNTLKLKQTLIKYYNKNKHVIPNTHELEWHNTCLEMFNYSFLQDTKQTAITCQTLLGIEDAPRLLSTAGNRHILVNALSCAFILSYELETPYIKELCDIMYSKDIHGLHLYSQIFFQVACNLDTTYTYKYCFTEAEFKEQRERLAQKRKQEKKQTVDWDAYKVAQEAWNQAKQAYENYKRYAGGGSRSGAYESWSTGSESAWNPNPKPEIERWYNVLGFDSPPKTKQIAKLSYYAKIKKVHPDTGIDSDLSESQKLTQAWEQAKAHYEN